jgi:hypothetical protein
MEPHTQLPFVVNLETAGDPGDVIDALALGDFVAGSHPYAKSIRLQRVRQHASLVPVDVRPDRIWDQSGCRSVLARGDGWTLLAIRWRDRTARLTVTALAEDLADRILREATVDASDPVPADGDHVSIGFWHRGRHGAERVARRIGAARWPEIRCNYTMSAASAFDQLTGICPPVDSGRLVLLHGPAGTGKTTALRALAHAWRPWCQVDVVLDPDQLLHEASYLTQVVLGDDDDDDDGRPSARWRMLVLEDCDELVRADAKRGTGQALSRLLNLTDGFIGQGRDILVCVTTNEPLDRLHPAIARPGRCLAEVHVGPFSVAEARAWLGHADAAIGRPMTLAELYARRGDLDTLQCREPQPAIGAYL